MIDREIAPAKVNLTLHVVGRRPDGYHRLESLVAFADLADTVRAAPGPPGTGVTAKAEGPFGAALGADGPSSLTKAARAFAAAQDPPAVLGDLAVSVEKEIPVAAGLGGGTADAAAFLRLLARRTGGPVDRRRLAAMAAQVGADGPACVWSAPLMMRGVGEVIDLAPSWPRLPAVLINPGVALSTVSVFARRAASGAPDTAEGPAGAPCEPSVDGALAWVGAGRNDLEAAAAALEPRIPPILAALRSQTGCVVARMSGSGATCFGLFSTDVAADTAAPRLSRAFPQAWVRRVALCATAQTR